MRRARASHTAGRTAPRGIGPSTRPAADARRRATTPCVRTPTMFVSGGRRFLWLQRVDGWNQFSAGQIPGRAKDHDRLCHGSLLAHGYRARLSTRSHTWRRGQHLRKERATCWSRQLSACAMYRRVPLLARCRRTADFYRKNHIPGSGQAVPHPRPALVLSQQLGIFAPKVRCSTTCLARPPKDRTRRGPGCHSVAGKRTGARVMDVVVQDKTANDCQARHREDGSPPSTETTARRIVGRTPRQWWLGRRRCSCRIDQGCLVGMSLRGSDTARQPGGATSSESWFNVRSTQPGNLRQVHPDPSDRVDFSWTFQYSLSSGIRSSTFRVLAIS